MREYHEVTSPPEPKMSDFYNPSRQQKDAELALVVEGMAAIGIVAYKFFYVLMLSRKAIEQDSRKLT